MADHDEKAAVPMVSPTQLVQLALSLMREEGGTSPEGNSTQDGARGSLPRDLDSSTWLEAQRVNARPALVAARGRAIAGVIKASAILLVAVCCAMWWFGAFGPRP